ncbi:uncharacterized protein J7T54_001806 [Emericellopsis cladophorae]|uniref:ER-bound oxygenase mpaB/mpaB'/Rubber oxygenase catalytic domain-containing protein n=1 Tax=Emericellopsis cladophorae TaxID=2686198 RepID=A0A9P9Y6G9_9HYPO|nr:uncharacterized protein J7T54_001806 [Emericellopsis cladophorae]KAI6783930.1 hypothetical protein J7T54_001806 [Emericellopsis cladophorae]
MGLSDSTWAGNASTAAETIDPVLHQGFVAPSYSALKPYLIASLIGYVTLCTALRHRRITNFQKKMGFTDRASLSLMSVYQAQAIARNMYYWEFPLFYDVSLRIALFRTYTVENVARVLANYSDLKDLKTSSKRYEDTAILYGCFAHYDPASDEFLKAVARMNYLHSPYVKSGKILDEDFLYVLWASMAAPVSFVSMYEWRSLTPMEHAAQGTLWKHIGDLMGIDYNKVMGKDKWADGIEFMDEVTEWASGYEDKYMKPLPEVRRIGSVLMELLAGAYPKFAKSTVDVGVKVLMGERMRHAFGLSTPGLLQTHLVYSALFFRQLVMRHFTLPRMFALKNLSEPDAQTGRIKHYLYLKDPWYNPVTIWTRWGPEAWLNWSLGTPIPGDQALMPQGFLWQDLGPEKRMGTGVAELQNTDHLAQYRSVHDSPF